MGTSTGDRRWNSSGSRPAFGSRVLADDDVAPIGDCGVTNGDDPDIVPEGRAPDQDRRRRHDGAQVDRGDSRCLLLATPGLADRQIRQVAAGFFTQNG
jgi:hypothetical protein